MTSDWVCYLDELSARLRQQRAALAGRSFDELVPFGPPSSLGPLPLALAARAQGLLTETEELQAALDAAASALGRDLRLIGVFTAGSNGATGRGASFLDTRG